MNTDINCVITLAIKYLRYLGKATSPNKCFTEFGFQWSMWSDGFHAQLDIFLFKSQGSQSNEKEVEIN